MSYAHALTQPRRKSNLAEPWHRMTSRWRDGGVEAYSLGQSKQMHPLQRLRLRSEFELTEQRMELENFPEAFRGFRIVHLTDIHHGLYLPAEALAAVVELANEMEPDIVALTGDFVTRSRAYIEPAAEVLSGLRAREGVFAVLGNHDFRVGPNEIARALDRKGIALLRNRHTMLRRRSQRLFLAGVDDLQYNADLSRAMKGIPKGASTLLLSHHPAIIEAAARRKVSLVLSGHTHGGQVRLPVVGSIYGRSQKHLRFKIGRDSLGATQIYVSRGIGTVVLPVRYGCPPEIPQLILDPTRRLSTGAPRPSSDLAWLPARPHARS